MLAAAALLAACIVVRGAWPGAAAVAPIAGPTEAGVFECRWTDLPVQIDGQGNEAAWKGAQVIDRFAIPWAGKPASTATRARLLWDRENLYFLAEMQDADIYAEVQEHDGRTWNDDVFELFFKPAEDKPGYYEFQVNAAGTMLDMFLPRRGDGGYQRYRSDDEFHMEAKVALRGTLNRRQDRDRNWLVEGRIPWRDFHRTGGRPEPNERWKFALCRYDYRIDTPQPELSTSAPLTKPSFHRVEDYASLRFVGPGRAHTEAVRNRSANSAHHLPGDRFSGPAAPLPRPARLSEAQADQPRDSRPGAGQRSAARHPPPSEWGVAPPSLQGRRRMSTPQKRCCPSIAWPIASRFTRASTGMAICTSAAKVPAEGPGGKMQIARFTMARRSPFGLDPASEEVIIEWPSNGHNGGGIVFGQDGMLYITTGDGTSDSDDDNVGQDMTRLLAKLLRIDVDHPEPGKTYSVPKDNPFVGLKDARPETWAFGFRNPWRMTRDQETGHIWVGNGGQDLWETAYLVERGRELWLERIRGEPPLLPESQAGSGPSHQAHSRTPPLRVALADGRDRLLRPAIPGAPWGVHLRRLLYRQDLGGPPRRHPAALAEGDRGYDSADHLLRNRLARRDPDRRHERQG